ncbi:UNKNOWN [Stylonychia lemnae]|uniref:Uncharacterized protein n=1 Tax=Stylonychia lemnae TaxID=5949 RepID=A0A078AYJ7_STYLE|nr:UNKNOWN [Stylonychia lemnae]|eukprot:CDW87239.1 UNKNOWN [Stylonychia lemnae]
MTKLRRSTQAFILPQILQQSRKRFAWQHDRTNLNRQRFEDSFVQALVKDSCTSPDQELRIPEQNFFFLECSDHQLASREASNSLFDIRYPKFTPSIHHYQMSMELEYQLLAVTTQNFSKVDYQLSPGKLAELEALIKTMEEIKNMMEQSHDEVVVDGVLYTATQTAAKYAFEAFDNGILSIGNIITETRYLIESIELVVDKTGDKYFQKSLITDLKEPLINLGHWIATMRSYTENIQQNYFRQSILVLLKVEKNYNKNKDLYTQVYQEWSKSELARTDDFQSNWVDIEKTINKIAEQYLSAFSSRKIMDMMAKVARMFNFQCEQVNKDLLNKKEELIKAEQRLAEKENTRNQLNFLWFAFWIAAAISQAVMASEVAAAQAASKHQPK